MNRHITPFQRLKLIFIISVLCLFSNVRGQIMNTTPVAFPGAEGHGRFTTGGRGGQVIFVTNLNDSGTGSFRAAIAQSGARIVVFKVSGLIDLKSSLKISNGNITIAGQTAPGDGICIKNYSLLVEADNVIIRYIRSRMGDAAAYEGDAMSGRNHKNIILDHCTMSWCTDEAASFYDNENFTMQWCVIAESLRESVHDKGTHGYGGIWGGKKASFHHNLLAHHDSRNPRMCGSRYTGRPDLELVDFRNNVIYNWGGNSAYAGEGGSYNFVNNYYRPGKSSSRTTQIFGPNRDDGSNTNAAGVHGIFYVKGNFMYGSAEVNADNWKGMAYGSELMESEIRSESEYNKGQITTHESLLAMDRVLTYAGASLSRDIHDVRVTSEVRQGKTTYSGSKTNTPKAGLIDTQSDVGGWPVYNSTMAPVDSDSDGMPDSWEDVNGLNKNLASDNKQYDLSVFYTNVEVYVNSLVGDISTAQLLGGEANYQDQSSKGATPTIAVKGSATIDSEIKLNESMPPITYSFTNASTAVVAGLPEGLSYSATSNEITISGTPTDYGVFDVYISTVGFVEPQAEVHGVLKVNAPQASFILDEGSELSQWVVKRTLMKEIKVTWEYARDVDILDLPSGVTYKKDVLNQSLTILGKPSATGNYNMAITTIGGTKDSTLICVLHVVNDESEILASDIELAQFNFYPNPLTSGSELTISGLQKNQIVAFQLVDLTGKVVFGSAPNERIGNVLRLDASPGIYHLLVQTDKGWITKKLIIR
jgi:hypothetical protein